MKVLKFAMVLAAMFCMLNSTGVFAVDEDPGADIEPTFQNAAQAQRAENLTAASFTEDDMVAARQQAMEDATKEINTLAEKYADGVVDQMASDYAYEEVKQLSRDHAINSVDTEDFTNLDERAAYYADKYVEEKAKEYALSVADADEDQETYQEAYEAALERATDPSFKNLWDTAYAEAISKALDEEAFSDWGDAYNYAYDRGTGGGDQWEDAFQSAYNDATERAKNTGIWQDAVDHAIARATNPDYPNAYQTEYRKALEAYVAGFDDDKLGKIYEMRFEEKLGWGVIAKRLGLEEYHNGLGNTWRHRTGPSIDDVEIPSGPTEEMSLEEELAQAAQRDLKSGWVRGRAGAGQKKGNSKKYVGLTQTSVTAGSVASETVGGKGNSSRGKGGSSSAAGKTKKSDNVSSNFSSSGNSPGKAKGNSKNSSVGSSKSNNGKGGSAGSSRSSSSKSDRGNSGKDSSKNSNAGGNGKGKGNGKK